MTEPANPQVDLENDWIYWNVGRRQYALEPTKPRTIVIKDPAIESPVPKIPLWIALYNAEIWRIDALRYAGTNFTFTLRHDADIANTGTEVVESGSTISSTTVTKLEGATLENPQLAQDEILWFELTAITGSVTALMVIPRVRWRL
jgi:hypothetical protein